MIARKIMVRACMVNSELNVCAVTSVLLGTQLEANDQSFQPTNDEEGAC